MILTEQNRNPERLGETRTFAVPENHSSGHSADTMKKRINASNEQSLAQKNQAVRDHARSAQTPQAAGRNAMPSAQNRQTGTVNQTGAQSGRQINSSPAAQNQNVNRASSAAGTSAVNSAAAYRPVSNSQSVRSNSQPLRNTSQSRAAVPRDMSRSRAVAPVDETLNTAQKPVPTSKPAVRSVSNPAAKDVQPRAQMMRTKVTDVTYLQSASEQFDSKFGEKNKNNKDKKPKEYSDEGGNTVVSVIKAIVYIIFVIIISVALALVIINVGNDVFSFVKSDEMVEVTIPEYATLDEVAEILYVNDIIKYPTIFKMYAVAENVDTDFLAGTYMVNGMMNYETLLGEFKEKPESGTVDITIPEGYTIDEMIDLFVEGYGIGSREGFVDVIQNGEFDYWFIDELEANGAKDGRIYRLEGYLFPDTYQFYKASSEYTVVNKMLKRFSQIFTKEYRAQCETLGYTVDEMITLASIIEKEAGSPADFFVVSSVFHNRLKSPWNFPKLESDATVVYVLSHEMGERTNITAADLELDTPYNTYLYNGFPPGPIANPSASAMLAALSPQNTNFYYFYTNKGTLYPSETKEQHDAIIDQFRNEAAAQQTTGDVQQ